MKVNWAEALLHAARSVPVFGLAGAVKLFLSRVTRRMYRLKPGRRHPIFVRGKTSDSVLLYTIFIAREYPAERFVDDATFIIDAGANVGYASVYFAHLFPNAEIVALEPEDANFVQLVRNTEAYPNIRALKGALWSEKGDLYISNPIGESWAFKCSMLKCDGAKKVPTHTLADLLAESGASHIDLFKCDIEGSEINIFSENAEWLKKVRTVMMEIHRGCWKPVFQAIAPYEYDCCISGENVVIQFR